MPETAGEVIESALQEIVVQAVEADLEPSEYQAGIKALNRMMSMYAVKGINLGYTIVNSLGDTVTVPEGAYDGVVKNLAVRLHPQFSEPGEPVDQLLVIQAREGLRAMRSLGIKITPSKLPSNVPIGSGAEENDGLSNIHFFENDSDDILTEQDKNIKLETNTERE